VEPVWRLTYGLDEKIGVANQLHDTTGKDLASVLESVDALVTTPSTAMLEGMLQGLPVALLDYHNRPHYVPATWRITARSHLDEALPELLNPSPARMLYQASILHDALECHSPATPRMVELIKAMHKQAAECLSRGHPLAFSRRILTDPHDGHHLPQGGCNNPALFPAQRMAAGSGAGGSELLAALHKLGYDWRQVADELGFHWDKAHQQSTARLQRELAQACRELDCLRRRRITARLRRVGQKILRLMGPSPRDKAA
jgi:hypothetical protein